MNSYLKTIIFFAFIFSGTTFSSAKQIAITFDDLPVNRSVSPKEMSDINNKILEVLDKHRIRVIGFVNENKLFESADSSERISILKRWIDKGNILGNHTYSHISLNHTPLPEYINDVIHGEKVSTQLMANAGLTLKYFRHPYLHTGLTPEIKNNFADFLVKHKYTVSPVTFDTDDWQFDSIYVEALAQGNITKAKKIADDYLMHTKAKFEFYEKATQTIFSYDIAQIWLLHVNGLNADVLEDLLKIAKDYDYSFISLEEALRDPVYENTADSYYMDFGVSWLYRWDYSNGLKANWKEEPEPNIGDISAEKGME